MSIRDQKAFSLIEVIIAILIMTGGLLALSGALIIGVTLPKKARQQEIAKQMANMIMESIIAAKETAPPGFTTFENLSYTDSNPPGRFVRGVAVMLEPGPDGVYCTCDDGQAPGAFNSVCPTSLGTIAIQVEIDPGPDGIYSSPNKTDNRKTQLLGFTREVIIQDLSTGIKQIEVRVNYPTPTRNQETVSLICQLNDFKKL
jgi:prepilin-type N-terminal cleavage/methylation domain-containing protein